MYRALIVAATVACLSTAASAQEKVYTLTVTASQLGVIATALSEQKYKDVAPLISVITQQIERQNRPPAPPAAPESNGEAGGQK